MIFFYSNVIFRKKTSQTTNKTSKMNPNFSTSQQKFTMIQDLYHRNQMAMEQRNYEEANRIRNFAYENGLYKDINTAGYSKRIILMTIGQKGINFKKITENNNLYSIWYNMEQDIIEFWGETSNILKAQKYLLTNIDKNVYLHYNFPGMFISDAYKQRDLINKYNINIDNSIYYDTKGLQPISISDYEFNQDAEQWYSHTHYGDMSKYIGGGNYEYELMPIQIQQKPISWGKKPMKWCNY